MKCMICEGWSFSHICKRCRNEHLKPSIYTRKILGSIPVYSFYKYDDIEALLHTKHTDLGYYIYRILAKESMKRFPGQSYQSRLLHPRRFDYKPFKEEEVILVDDILTTGLTLTQAAEALHREGKKVLFCLTLADAEKKQ